jgi:hydrogenase expression/formation protein HypE
MPDNTIDTEPKATIDMESWVCPAPLRDSPNIVMGHGGGGAMSGELIEHLFLPAFGPAADAGMGDSAVVNIGGARLAFSTDSFVVKPMVFPGGTIGDLAVNGTVNDLAMAGARPMVMSTAFILEEGTPLDEIARIAQALGTAAMAAGVKLVTGDTKVVDSGHGDGVYINTAGIGLVDERADIRPQRAAPGDVVIVSGDIGVHGVAVMSCRAGLEFATTIASDTAPLHGLVAAMLDTGADIHVLRDPTRGGVAATLNEIARTAKTGISLDERTFPIPAEVRDACGLLGLDPLYVANEGKLLAFVPAADADRVLAAMREHPLGARAAVIGECVTEHPGMVSARTALGGTRVVDLPIGEQLPRIC